MEVEFKKSFVKDLKDIHDKELFNKIKLSILELEKTSTLYEMNNVKYIVNSKCYYRIRIGDYRIGMKVENNKV